MVSTKSLGLKIFSVTYVVRPGDILDNRYGRAAAANTQQSISRVGVGQGIEPWGSQDGMVLGMQRAKCKTVPGMILYW